MAYYIIEWIDKYTFKANIVERIEDATDIFYTEDELRELSCCASYRDGFFTISKKIKEDVEELIKPITEGKKKSVEINDNCLIENLEGDPHGILSNLNLSRRKNKLFLRPVKKKIPKKTKKKPTKEDCINLFSCATSALNYKFKFEGVCQCITLQVSISDYVTLEELYKLYYFLRRYVSLKRIMEVAEKRGLKENKTFHFKSIWNDPTQMNEIIEPAESENA